MKRNKTLLSMFMVLVGGVMFTTNHVQATQTNTSEEQFLKYSTGTPKKLSDIQAKFEPGMSSADYLYELKVQYLRNNPEYHGKVNVYTTDEYDKKLEGRSYKSIDIGYLRNIQTINRNDNAYLGGSYQPVDATKYPYNMVHKLSQYWNRENGEVIVSSPFFSTRPAIGVMGSGFKTGNTRGGTAAHCLYNSSYGGYISGGIVVYGLRPGGPQDTFDGIAQIKGAHVPDAYISSEGGSFDVGSDYGAMDLAVTWGTQPSTNFTLVDNTAPTANGSAIGYPAEGGYAGNQAYETVGSVFEYAGDPINVYESTTMMNEHGSSGGPLLDQAGRVIGINSVIFTYSNGNTTAGYKRLTPGATWFLLNN